MPELPDGVVQMNLRLPVELREELRREAARERRSMNDVAIIALELYIAAAKKRVATAG